MSKIIIVSNRLPVTIEKKDEQLIIHQSTGGLATGMKSVKQDKKILWIGWPGASYYKEDERKLVTENLKERDNIPVFIPDDIFDDYYEGFSNETLWPSFHYFQGYAQFSSKYFKAYKKANELFAEVVNEHADEGDTIWVQDYQLMLLPKMIRDLKPKVKMGYFLHIPFPSYEIFRTLPWCKDLIHGVLGADLIGFHTYDYMRHFQSAVMRILNINQPYLGKFNYNNRLVSLNSFPMGIDYEKFSDAVENEAVKAEIERYSETYGNTKLILSIDRLDYTKGILKRIKAFKYVLETCPQYLGKVSMLIILVPSRSKIPQYSTLKDKIDLAVGRVNGEYGTSDWSPIHYYYRAFRFERLIAYYNISPVAMVTPLRDGMNLVAKEYLACKKDHTGVLLLSEMAGASKELTNAIIVNPNSIYELSEGLKEALEMSETEQIKRNIPMQRLLKRKTVTMWANSFLKELNDVVKEREHFSIKLFTNEHAAKIKNDYLKSKKRLLLLDYDGTLKEFTKTPELARPDDYLMNMLKILNENPKNELVIITGRDNNTMEEWWGQSNINLITDHGVWSKLDDNKWTMIDDLTNDWFEDILEILQIFVDNTPGSLIEEKTYSLAWHYRNVDPGLALLRTQELVNKLANYLSQYDLALLEGKKVIEIKNSRINKGFATHEYLKNYSFDFILSIGDDATDEDTFNALPNFAHTIKVGEEETHANCRIGKVKDVHQLLNSLIKLEE